MEIIIVTMRKSIAKASSVISRQMSCDTKCFQVFLIACVFLLSLIPVVHTYIQAKASWAGVVPSFVDDDLYYYARMQNITHGYPFIGNPYFFEHRNEINPAFFAADWLAVIPEISGMSLVAAVVFNFIAWSIFLSVLTYSLFREYKLSKLASIAGSLIIYASAYTLMLRPVSMQIVAPFFLLFCIAYARWIKAETPSIVQNIFLIATISLSFYVYTYLWQIVLSVLGLTALYILYRKEWGKLKQLCIAGVGGIIFGLPAILYTLKQITSPYYWDSMARIGLVNTHIPTALSFFDGGIICALLVLFGISYLWVNNLKNNHAYKDFVLCISLVGLGLCVALFSNLLTGKELEISNHVERFIIIWVDVSFIIYFWFFMQIRHEFYALNFYRKAILSVLFGISFAVCAYYFVRGCDVQLILHADTVSVQAYGDPLKWLDRNTPKESVIWSSGKIGDYIPILTDDFQLFHPLGGLHLVPSHEIEERYLVSHYFDNLTLLDIEKNFREYAGAGNAIHQYKTHDRKVRICQLLGLSHFGVDCGQRTDPVSFKGEKYFMDLYVEYESIKKTSVMDKLKKFNVAYIIKDNSAGNTFSPVEISGSKLVWSNGRFEIYSVNYK